MYLAAQVVGIFAVASFLLSYQMKKRRHIVLINALSNVLYVLQYIMLGAFEGAAIDVLSTVSSFAAHNKDKGIVGRWKKPIFILLNIAFIAAGLALYKNVFSLCAIAGAILQTGALWITKEKTIRLVSFVGAPFWLIYNLTSGAYGPALGSALCMVSIGVAIYRYDIIKQQKN